MHFDPANFNNNRDKFGYQKAAYWIEIKHFISLFGKRNTVLRFPHLSGPQLQTAKKIRSTGDIEMAKIDAHRRYKKKQIDGWNG